MPQLKFGTDGFRGEFDPTSELGRVNAPTFERITYAFASWARDEYGETPDIVTGMDTRTTSPELEAAASDGAQAAEATVLRAGILPTPAIAMIARDTGALGAAINASHNHKGDNGIKLFGPGGVKLSRDALDAIAEIFEKNKDDELPYGRGRSRDYPDALEYYVDNVSRTVGDGEQVLQGKTVMLDGANGAAYEAAPQVFSRLGANVIMFACEANGERINDGCGAADLRGIRAMIKKHAYLSEVNGFMGAFSLDGDADRAIGTDARGNTIDGNHWMARLAKDQKGIVGTLYTNPALRKYVQGEGVEFHECANGDSYVTALLQYLTREYGPGFTRGGEFTGHLVDLNYLPSGDGTYMTAWMAAELAKSDMTLADIWDWLPLWPERMVNIPTQGRDAAKLMTNPDVASAISNATTAITKQGGLVIVRPSGTESYLRVFAAAQDQAQIDHHLGAITECIRSIDA